MAKRYELSDTVFSQVDIPSGQRVLVPADGQSYTVQDLRGNPLPVYPTETGGTGVTSGASVDGNLNGWVDAPDFDVVYADGSRFAVRTTPPGAAHFKSYGARGDGLTDDQPAIQAAADSLPVNGGTLLSGPGDFICASPLNLDDRRSIVIQGAGGRSAGASVASRITFSGIGAASFLSCRSCYGFTIRDVWVAYSSGSYTGNLIDFSHSATGGDGAYNSIERCVIGGTGPSARSAVGVFVNKSQTGSIRDSVILNLDIGVKGKSVNADYCANWKLDTVGFPANTITTACIRNAGNAWLVQNCTFEPLVSGAANAYDHDANVTCNGMTWLSNLTADASSGTWITFAGTDFTAIGNEIQSGTTGISIDNGLTNSVGIVITGNRFNSLTNGIVIAANVTRYLVGYNNFATVTNNYTLAGIAGADVDWVGDPGGSTNLKTAYSIESALNIKPGPGGYFNGGGSTAAGTIKMALGVGAEANARFQLLADGTIIRGPGGATAPTTKSLRGTGSPEGVVTAGIGSTYQREDGGAGTSFYVKESGAGNTGWVAK